MLRKAHGAQKRRHHTKYGEIQVPRNVAMHPK